MQRGWGLECRFMNGRGNPPGISLPGFWGFSRRHYRYENRSHCWYKQPDTAVAKVVLTKNCPQNSMGSRLC
jgi:hypothetical protein